MNRMACLRRVLTVCALLVLPAALAGVSHPASAARSYHRVAHAVAHELRHGAFGAHTPAAVVERTTRVRPLEDNADDNVDPAPQDALTTDIRIPYAPRGSPLPSTAAPSWTPHFSVSSADPRGPPLDLS
jgi:hypothetical protein